MRRITNFDAVKDFVKERTGIEIDLVTGEEEARLSFIGAKLLGSEIKCGVMADLGGASTELISFEGDAVRDLHSFPFGCLYLYDRFVCGRFPTVGESRAITEFVTAELSSRPIDSAGNELILIGGTGKAIRKILRKFGYNERQNPVSALDGLAARLSKQQEDDVALLERLIPARVETVIPGLLAYIAAAKAVNADSFTVSDGGIREGYLIKLMDEET